MAGAYVLEQDAGSVHTIVARATVLATGGAGKVYLYTTNPDVATGDGVAMAYRAGAEVANMEFFQFHPTVPVPPAGQELPDQRGAARRGRRAAPPTARRSWRATTRMAELAPRDVVARAIDFEMKRTGAEYVLLDITRAARDFLRERFPNIYAECLRVRHRHDAASRSRSCRRRTTCAAASSPTCTGGPRVPGLWAIGETACTGLHGANRLASNSLLEGLVFGQRAARALATRSCARATAAPEVPDWQTPATRCRATRRSSSRTTGTSCAA